MYQYASNKFVCFVQTNVFQNVNNLKNAQKMIKVWISKDDSSKPYGLVWNVEGETEN